MIRFTQGNLREAKTEALVNTVNTVGVMGKGIALMFKERFSENYRLYSAACKAGAVETGKMHVTAVNELDGPRWIVNFPTKRHWRSPSQMAWITEGLYDLRRFLLENQVKSVAVPPLGAGNGGLKWPEVREQIVSILSDLDVDILVFEPSKQYLNVAKRNGVEKLTPARALIAELVRRYWVLGMECSLLEIQKLAWFLERAIEKLPNTENPLDLKFVAHKFGPYANRLEHLLNNLDGSYLHCNKRISDADINDVIWFDDVRKTFLQTYLKTEAKEYAQALERTAELIDGFESPFGMELLATVDWLLYREGISPTVPAVREALKHWDGGAGSAARKNRLFDDQALDIALKRLTTSSFSLELVTY
ncbi:Appr-1-p processing protein [Pseudomonas sp. TKO26]|uniref:type II toxin-antitoxin system antitoxin DNA ADP-ribosyl glycohydrolase DarG n=1 Tax=unclassified Pseudomonas TaxID=196821 RepID=UPI000D98F7E4|nr:MULTISPECIES: macro domain-containing protein [unclassified Pseudomonas]PYY87146.1 Appr-1-p processing protein [Pseudomonas sp. TKO30]PYY90009.1 Appr-1-p processing protein [Pseudomonas sp. TKO29]PYY93097.1 Appr-1-p processing protein [Pseudomonas sp. TKO26]